MVERLAPIPHQTLAYLLDQVGEPGALSPRHRLGEPAAPSVRQRVELAVCGYTQSADDPTVLDSFRPIAQTLLDPTSVVDVRVWHGIHVAWNHTALRGLHGVGITDDGSRSVIAGPVGPADLAELVLPLLEVAKSARAEPGVEFAMVVDAETAAALAAVLDAARQAASDGSPESALPITAVVDAAIAPADTLVAGSLRLHSRIMSREPGIPDRAGVGAGLRRLADADVIALDQTSVHLTATTAALARLLPLHTGAFRWQRRTLDDVHGSTVTDRIVSVGDAGLILEVALAAPGFVAWHTRTPDEALQALAAELAFLSTDG